MRTRVFIGNVDYDATEHDLKQAFLQCGCEPLSIRLVTDPQGKPRGFGFVDLEDEETAARAISALNGVFINGRQISVREAKSNRAKAVA